MKEKYLKIMVLLLFVTIAFASEKDNIKIKQLLYKANNQKLFFNSEAIKLANEALSLSLKIGKKQQIIESYIVLGELLRLFNYNTASLEAYQNAYKYSMENKYEYLNNQIFLELAETYRASQIYDEAIRYVKKSIYLSIQKNEDFLLAKAYNRYAAILFEYAYQENNLEYEKKYDTNYVFYNKNSYVAKEKLNRIFAYIDSSDNYINKNNIAYKRILLSNYNLKATTLTFLQKFKKASVYFQQAVNLGEEINDLMELPIIYINYSNFYTKNKNFKKGIEYGIRAFELSKKNRIINYEMYATQRLYIIYDKLGNLTEAMKYLLLKDSLSHQINQDNMQTQSYFFNLKYDEIKERENLKIQSKVIIYQYILIGMTIIFALIISLLFYKKQKNQRNINKDLTEKNYVISVQKEQLQKSIDSRNKLFAVLSHDMRSPFLGLSGFADLLYDEYETLPAEEKKFIIYEMRNSIKKIFQQINNMFEWAKLQIGFYEYTPKNIDLFSSVVLCTNIFSSNALKKGIKIINHIKPNTHVFADQNMLNSILHNLLSNAIKFSPIKGEIILKIEEENNCYNVLIEDKGVGIEKDKIDDIFDANKISASIGTDGEIGNGLGLKIVKEMIEMNEGSIKVESEINKGTTFIFSLKKAK